MRKAGTDTLFKLPKSESIPVFCKSGMSRGVKT